MNSISRIVAGFAGPLRARLLLGPRRRSYDRALAPLPRIDRTAIVFGSAPNPTPPEVIDHRWFAITVNASRVLATDLGFPDPDLTIFRDEIWDEDGIPLREPLQGHGTKFLVVNLAEARDRRIGRFLREIDYHAEQVLQVSRHVRGAVILEMSGLPYVMLGGTKGISNGVYAALLALKLGAPRVILTGFSMGDGWYFARHLAARRNHKSKDLDLCQSIAAQGLPVFATDPEFASRTGLRLWSPAFETPGD